MGEEISVVTKPTFEQLAKEYGIEWEVSRVDVAHLCLKLYLEHSESDAITGSSLRIRKLEIDAPGKIKGNLLRLTGNFEASGIVRTFRAYFLFNIPGNKFEQKCLVVKDVNGLIIVDENDEGLDELLGL